jgi:hypothetical protein
MPAPKRTTPEQAKESFLKAIKGGASVADACESAGRSRKWYENARAVDRDFAGEVDAAREKRDKATSAGRDADLYELTFAEWRKRFLNLDTYPHQQLWIDVLEGREPTLMHPSVRYEPAENGARNRVLINTPPFHCAEISTPVLTKGGWKVVGDLTTDDFVVGHDGLYWPIYDTWTPESEVPMYRVTFDSGDSIVTDDQHIWEVTKTFTSQRAEMTTAQLMGDLRWQNKQNAYKWKVRLGAPLRGEHSDTLPVDPYLLGYWLGDGDTSGSRLSVSAGDLAPLLSYLDGLGLTYSTRPDSRGGQGNVVYVHKIRQSLPLGNKRIPAAYFTASFDQRMALLRGLMDTDGTINAKDGRCSFIQVDDDLTRDVYRLIASLGFKVSWKREKQNALAPNGKSSGPTINRLYFKPNGIDVFSLERKAAKQKVTTSRIKTNFRTIRSIEPVGSGMVKCVSVSSPGDLFAIGDGMILTHNAKSATVTQQWITYKLCMNPAMRVMIVGKTAEAASKHLYAIRQYLTDPNFIELQAAYGPADGFKPQRGEGRWANNLIYLAGRNLDAADKAAKDPSVQAVGIGGAIYGARCDLIILDDAVDDTNYSAYEKQFDWLTRTVQSRVYDGKLIIVGTRIKPMDLYAYLLNGDNYMSGKTPWTYLAQPAVFEYAEDPKDWKTLWPKSSTPMDEGGGDRPDDDGLFPAWGGERLNGIRSSLSPGTWALVYQQEQVSEDMTFHPVCVWGSVDKRRSPGPLRPGEIGGRRNGMEGMQVILSIDPAGTGEAFMMVYAVDRQTRERWVLQAWMGSNTKLSWYAEMIEQIIPEYSVTDLVIERQGYSNWLYQDERIVNFCRQRGIRISPHYTGVGNKIDPDFGVASLAGLFGGLVRRENAGNTDHDGENIIHLPNPDKSPGIKALVDQLLTWVPGKSGSKLRQDGPMALWFAEMRVRSILFGSAENGGGPSQFVKANRFLSTRAKSRRSVRPSLFTH